MKSQCVKFTHSDVSSIFGKHTKYKYKYPKLGLLSSEIEGVKYLPEETMREINIIFRDAKFRKDELYEKEESSTNINDVIYKIHQKENDKISEKAFNNIIEILNNTSISSISGLNFMAGGKKNSQLTIKCKKLLNQCRRYWLKELKNKN